MVAGHVVMLVEVFCHSCNAALIIISRVRKKKRKMYQGATPVAAAAVSISCW